MREKGVHQKVEQVNRPEKKQLGKERKREPEPDTG